MTSRRDRGNRVRGSELSTLRLEPGAETQVGANRERRILVLKLVDDDRHVVGDEVLALGLGRDTWRTSK